MKATTKARVLDWTGLGVSIAAPLVATGTQFPIFVEKGSSQTISGVFIFVLIIAMTPAIIFLHRQAQAGVKINVPYALIGSWALVAALFTLESILPQAEIIALSWAGGTSTGKVMTMIGHHIEKKDAKARDVAIDNLLQSNAQQPPPQEVKS